MSPLYTAMFVEAYCVLQTKCIKLACLETLWHLSFKQTTVTTTRCI